MKKKNMYLNEKLTKYILSKRNGFPKSRINSFIKYFLIFIILVIFFFIYVLISDVKFLFSKTEIGHLFSYIVNMNDFKFYISEKQKKWEVLWNDEVIYLNGKINRVNVNKSRYTYGNNRFIIKINNQEKEYKFFKENNWDYHKFKININDNEINFWIDDIIQKDST